MYLIRFGKPNKEKPGIVLNGARYDVSAFGEDFGEAFFETNGLARLQKWVKKHQKDLPLVSNRTRLGPPVMRPSKLICIGLNYADHAAETGAEIPKEPILFFKSTTAICGPNDNLIIPRTSEKTDWEVELAVVIGTKATYITEAEAPGHIAGYMLHNDYSERDFQFERGGQWVKGKSCDSFAPLGPWMATPDEIPDINHLGMWLMVNDKTMQLSNTSNLIFKIPKLISYISQFMTLLPGDIISTGTPPGVGLGMKPPVFIRPGDVIELGIEGLGRSRQVAV